MGIHGTHAPCPVYRHIEDRPYGVARMAAPPLHDRFPSEPEWIAHFDVIASLPWRRQFRDHADAGRNQSIVQQIFSRLSSHAARPGGAVHKTQSRWHGYHAHLAVGFWGLGSPGR